jgi:hypothetical protein
VVGLIEIADQGVPTSTPFDKRESSTPRHIPLFSNILGYEHAANYGQQASYDIKRAPSNPEKPQRYSTGLANPSDDNASRAERLGGRRSRNMFASGDILELDDELMKDHSEDGDVVNQLLARWTTLRPSSDEKRGLSPREDEKLASMQSILPPRYAVIPDAVTKRGRTSTILSAGR